MSNYANLHGYSDIQPFEIIARSSKTITLRGMHAEKDPAWKPEFDIGGFVAHCSNQSEQKWIISSAPARTPFKAYLRKDGHYHSRLGKHVLSDKPRSFYDYNF